MTIRYQISRRTALGAIGALPVATTALGAHAQAKKPIAIPFVMTPDRRMVTSLTIGGKGPYLFIIDTGASTSGINATLARELRLRDVTRQGSVGLGGRGDNFVYEANDIVFADTFKIAGMAFTGFENLPFKYVDGMLSAGFLTGVPSQIDYEQGQIIFYPTGSDMDLTGFQKVSSHRESDGSASEKIYVDLMLDGEKINCLLDTGAPPALYLSSHYVRAHKLWDKNPSYQDRVATGIEGDKVKTRFTHAQSLEVAGFAVDGAPVTLGDPTGEDFVTFMDGILGMGAIGRFNLAFAKDGLYVKPNKFFKDTASLFVAPTQKVP